MGRLRVAEGPIIREDWRIDVDILDRISKELARHEEQTGQPPEAIHLTDEEFAELADHISVEEARRQAAAREAQAFLDAISTSFPNVDRRTIEPYEPKELTWDALIWGLPLRRAHR